MVVVVATVAAAQAAIGARAVAQAMAVNKAATVVRISEEVNTIKID